jgi:hypothetical protein
MFPTAAACRSSASALLDARCVGPDKKAFSQLGYGSESACRQEENDRTYRSVCLTAQVCRDLVGVEEYGTMSACNAAVACPA